MEIILSSQCKSITGTLGTNCGYALQMQNGRCFAKRNSKGHVPPDGHWLFIVTCANLTKARIYAIDIILSGRELTQALEEADITYAPRIFDHDKLFYAQDILTLAVFYTAL